MTVPRKTKINTTFVFIDGMRGTRSKIDDFRSGHWATRPVCRAAGGAARPLLRVRAPVLVSEHARHHRHHHRQPGLSTLPRLPGGFMPGRS
jgi:hypothetical protein